MCLNSSFRHYLFVPLSALLIRIISDPCAVCPNIIFWLVHQHPPNGRSKQLRLCPPQAQRALLYQTRFLHQNLPEDPSRPLPLQHPHLAHTNTRWFATIPIRPWPISPSLIPHMKPPLHFIGIRPMPKSTPGTTQVPNHRWWIPMILVQWESTMWELLSSLVKDMDVTN